MKASSALRRFRPEAPYLVTAMSFLTRLSPLLLSELSLLCLRLGHQNLCLDRTWKGDPKLLTASRFQHYLANVLALTVPNDEHLFHLVSLPNMSIIIRLLLTGEKSVQ